MLSGFPKGSSAVVFGAGGGIGRAFVDLLASDPNFDTVFACGRNPAAGGSKVAPKQVDILDEASIAALCEDIKAAPPRLILIASGMLHDGDDVQPEKSWRQLELEQMQRVFAINTFASALVMKHMLPIMPREGKSVLAALSARVGSISDNGIGGWYSYRASKAALNMLLRTAAIEHGRRWKDACVVGLHPGTVDTGLSQPFQGNVPKGQLQSPQQSAASMLAVLDQLGPDDSGQVYDYAGKPVPF